MIVVYSIDNVPIRLTHERWKHITSRHPEMKNEKERLVETISNPDFVQRGDFGTLLAVRFYGRTPLTAKYLVVVYKEMNKEDGFILTAYFTNKPSERREIIWKR